MDTMRLNRTMLAVVFGLLLTSFLGSPVVAQPVNEAREEITLTPVTSNLDVKAGESVSGEFTVLNTGSKNFAFTVYARPYSVDTKEYAPNYSDTPERSRAYAWVQFAESKGQLAPGESKKIAYTATVPAGTAPGGHYGVLFAETVVDNPSSEVIARSKRVGSVLRMRVEGDIRERGNVTDISTPWLQFNSPLISSADVNNAGNVDFEARSELSIYSVFGKKLFSTQQNNIVYPDKPRTVTTQWQSSQWIGLYKVTNSIDVPGASDNDSSYVLLVPRWMLVLLAMIALAGGLYAVYRRFR